MTVHHEMGHVQYFLQYKDLASVFKDGSNPGNCLQCLQCPNGFYLDKCLSVLCVILKNLFYF